MLFIRRFFIVLLGTLSAYGCQPNRLQVTGEGTIEKSRGAMTPVQQSMQHSLKISPSEQSSGGADTTAQQESTSESALSTSAAVKRSLPHGDTLIVPKGKKVCSASLPPHTTSQASSSALCNSLAPPEPIVKRGTQDIAEALKKGKRTGTTEDMNEKDFEGFQEWFKKFTAKVDHEEAADKRETHELVEEGNKKAYLTKALEIRLDELDWDADFTPLHYAAARGDHQAVRALLKYVNPDIKNSEACTPLHFAAYAGHLAVAEALVDQCKKEPDIQAMLNAKDDQGSSPIFYAAGGPRTHGNVRVIELLAKNEVDLAQTLDGSTLIDIAASLGNVEVVEYCLTKMKEIALPQGSNVSSIIESAMKLAKQENQYDAFVMLHDYLKDTSKGK